MTARALAGAAISVVLAACASTPEPVADAPLSEPQALAPSEKSAPHINGRSDAAEPKTPRLIFFEGGEDAPAFETGAAPAPDAKLELNFVDAPIADVARAVIGEALGETVSIGDGVSGQITLTSPKPVDAADALAGLEALLADVGVALIQKDVGFALTPMREAASGPQTLRRPGRPAVGFGITIAPLDHAKAGEMLRLVEPLKSQRVSITTDETRNLLFLRGPQPDVAATLEAIELFDVDWLAERTVGLFEVRYAEAGGLKEELDTVFERIGSVRSGAVELIALPRLNVLMVAAADAASFAHARKWIERLDRPANGSAEQLHYYVAKNTPAVDLAAALTTVFGGGAEDEYEGAMAGETSIVADEINNALIIRATPSAYREVLDLIERMDQLSPQVLIEATIAEVRLTDDLRYGVQWFLNADSEQQVTFSESGEVVAQFPGIAYTYFSDDIRVALNALASVTDVNVVSAPKLMVINNQTATLQVGDEVPIVTQQAQSVGDPNAPLVTTVELRDTGVILEVKPRINSSHMVVLEVSQEVSDVTQTTTSGIDSPTIQQRRFSSTVAVQDGETVALGGLIRDTHSETETAVPILSRIPGLGAAFRTRDITERRTELIVFLTPHIIGDVNAARETLDILRSQMRHLQVTSPVEAQALPSGTPVKKSPLRLRSGI